MRANVNEDLPIMQSQLMPPLRTVVARRNTARFPLLRAAVFVALGGSATVVAQAALTSIADMPLITSNEFHAKPNLMFVLDNSGSMARAYMPDDMDSEDAYGYRSSQCNGVAYDPDTNVSYAPPVDWKGDPKSNATYTNAWNNGYDTGDGSTNLSQVTEVDPFTTSSNVTIGTGNKTFTFTSSRFRADSLTVGQTVTLTYDGRDNRWMTGTVTEWTPGSPHTLKVNIPNNNSIQTGNNNNSGTSWAVSRTSPSFYYKYTATGADVQPKMGWTYTSDGKVDKATPYYKQCMSPVGSTPGSGVFTKVYVTAAEQQRYANWYSYYRTRTLLMRTAVGQAFKVLNSDYRVGFSTISNTGVTDSAGFQSVGDFEGTQRQTLYTKLYGATGNSTTPLRASLAKIGRYYGKQFSGQTDPIQYACQRNYTLLSTDGYWNTGTETSSYGPFDLDGRDVGNQDANEARPMFDGSVSSTLWSRTTDYVGARNGNGCSGGTYKVRTTAQTSTDNVNWTPNAPAPSNNNGTCRAAAYIVANGGSASAASGFPVSSVPTSTPITTGGSDNSLADVAAYYYNTDLRHPDRNNCDSSASGTAQKVCSNVVETSGRDTAKHQHMTTFTVGLGVSGTLAYDRNYLNQASGAYADLTKATNPSNWPVPVETRDGGDARQIDDLWHAAVNGRGQYYSALNATQLAEAIKGVTDAIGEKFGSASAATTSTLELVSGDANQVYRASYTTGTWVGDVEALSLDGDTGVIGKDPIWSAQAKLKSTAYTARKIYYLQPGTTPALRNFEWSNLNADGLGANFTDLCVSPAKASQCADLTTTEKNLANSGTNLVNFLRGDTVYQTASTANSTTKPLYRARTAVLGDIINGAPKYVSKPSFSYSDAGYTDFVQAKKDRKPMLYVAANDGMLHAFSADTKDTSGGTELWAYVPRAVMPEMYRLADSSYRSQHRYFVDAPPVVGDIYVGGQWKTILVGGLGKGGRSYYALDITDPEKPQALWEFSDTNLGLTFGNPIITKRADGTWVVMFSSGYNNVDPNGGATKGDGIGRLFVVNANTGIAARTPITTGVGSIGTPSGLDKINGWIDQETDNTTKRVYAGDLMGNLWRFDIDGLTEPKNSALLLANFSVASQPQPITTRPRLASVNNNKETVVLVGTGQYLNTEDISNTATQTLYAIKDALASTGLGDVRNNATMVKQTLSPGEDASTANITNLPVNWVTNNGWWVDFPHSGERVNTEMALQSDVLAIATAIPRGDACDSGGSSWNYFLSVSTGSSLQNTAGAQVSPNSLIVGQSFVRMADGKLRLLRQLSDGTTAIVNAPGGSNSPISAQRTSWRELTD